MSERLSEEAFTEPGAGSDSAAEEDNAFARALRALGRKERTTSEMRAWLLEREFSEAVAEVVVDRLEEVGALDDADFAARFAEDKRQISGWGNERVRQTLLRRGVKSDQVELVVGEEDEEVEAERAAGVVESRGLDISDDRARGKVLAFLVRRGYRYDVAYAAIRRLAA